MQAVWSARASMRTGQQPLNSSGIHYGSGGHYFLGTHPQSAEMHSAVLRCRCRFFLAGPTMFWMLVLRIEQ